MPDQPPGDGDPTGDATGPVDGGPAGDDAGPGDGGPNGDAAGPGGGNPTGDDAGPGDGAPQLPDVAGGSRLARWVGLAGLAAGRVKHRTQRGSGGQATVTAGGIALAVALVLVVSSVGLGLADDRVLGATATDAWVLAPQGPSSVVTEVGDPSVAAAHERADAMEAHDAVTAATPVLVRSARLRAPDGDVAVVRLVGVVPGPTDRRVLGLPTAALTDGDPHYANGSYDGPWPGEAVLGERAATRLGVDASATLAPTGPASDRQLSATAVEPRQTAGDPSGLPVVLTHLSAAQRIAGGVDADAGDATARPGNVTRNRTVTRPPNGTLAPNETLASNATVPADGTADGTVTRPPNATLARDATPTRPPNATRLANALDDGERRARHTVRRAPRQQTARAPVDDALDRPEATAPVAASNASHADRADQFLVATDGPVPRAHLADAVPGGRVVVAGGDRLRNRLTGNGLPVAVTVAALLVGGLVGTLFVVTTVGLDLAAGARDRAVLAAVGVSRRSRSALVIVETLLAALLGGVVGVGLWVVALFFERLAVTTLGHPPVMAALPSFGVLGLAVALGIAFFATPILLALDRNAALAPLISR